MRVARMRISSCSNSCSKPGSVGGPPRAVQISGHHLENDDVVAAVLRFSPCRLSIVDCDSVELALQFFRHFSELRRRESAAKVIGERQEDFDKIRLAGHEI